MFSTNFETFKLRYQKFQRFDLRDYTLLVGFNNDNKKKYI